MSEPLSKLLGFKKDEVYGGTFADNQIQIGKNMMIDDLDQLSPDAKELSRIIANKMCDCGISQDGERMPCPICMYYQEAIDKAAQEIINKMSEWIVKKGN